MIVFKTRIPISDRHYARSDAVVAVNNAIHLQDLALLRNTVFRVKQNKHLNCIADNVNQFKNRLDKHGKMHDIVFNYRADFAETEGLA